MASPSPKRASRFFALILRRVATRRNRYRDSPKRTSRGLRVSGAHRFGAAIPPRCDPDHTAAAKSVLAAAWYVPLTLSGGRVGTVKITSIDRGHRATALM